MQTPKPLGCTVPYKIVSADMKPLSLGKLRLHECMVLEEW